jgi:tripartite-type tricarboxylate transporter receptor subunit TctC
MNKNVVKALLIVLTMVLATNSVTFAAEGKYPVKPITNIVSWAAGGTTDISQRLLASVLPKYLGQTMVIENQAGGAAVPGTTAIAKAAPDGYTVGVNWGASWTLRPFILDVPYKMEDFVFIVGMCNQKMILCVNADSPFQTLEDVIKYAKDNPGELNYGAGDTASYQHLVAAAFAHEVGIEAEMIPYNGSRPSVVAMMGKNLDYCVVEPGNVLAETQAGKIRVLCAFDNERIKELPDVPTAKERGFNLSFPQSQCIVGPAGIPVERVKILHDALKATLTDPDFLKLAANAGLEIEYKSGEEVQAEIMATIRQIQPIIAKIFPKQ